MTAIMGWLQLAGCTYLIVGYGVACFFAGLERGCHDGDDSFKPMPCVGLLIAVIVWPALVGPLRKAKP